MKKLNKIISKIFLIGQITFVFTLILFSISKKEYVHQMAEQGEYNIYYYILLCICFIFFIGLYKFGVVYLKKRELDYVKSIYLTLTNEEIQKLKLNEIEIIEHKRKMWKQTGKIIGFSETSNKVIFTVVWYNDKSFYVPSYNNFYVSKVKLSKAEQELHNFKENQQVSLLVIPNKQEKMVVCAFSVDSLKSN